MIIADGHVHIHPQFDLERFLQTAADNLRRKAVDEFGRNCFGVLLLTECSGTDAFSRLSGGKLFGEWRVEKDGEWLLTMRSGSDHLSLAAGRQIATREGLEVLALMTNRNIKDGMSLQDSVEAVRDVGAVPVIPWGFGKWSGERGRILENFIEQEWAGEPLYFGDNGNRPGMMRRPEFFERGERAGIRILPGSDPLPFRSEVSRAGLTGFFLPNVDGESMALALRSELESTDSVIQPYGVLETPFRFLRNQVAMQIVKRRRGKAERG